MAFKIAVLPGDGIGPEVIVEGVKVLKAAQKLIGGFQMEFEFFDAGAEYFKKTGIAFPDSTFTACKDADAIFLGAMGLPNVVQEDGTEVQGKVIIELRKSLDLYAGLRPIRLRPGVKSPIIGKDKIDFVIIRESTEGLFASFQAGASVYNEVHVDPMVITRKGTERVCRYAFECSRKRNGRPLDGKKVVTCVDKSNNFKGMAFWRKIYDEVADSFPDISRDYSYVDAITLLMIQKPEAYDVMVTENIFGDIISDLAAGLVGGMGMAPSAEIGDKHAMFEPAHGSAPTIANKNIANPIATILSGAMMLEWLGEKYHNDSALKASQLIDKAVDSVLEKGNLTSDLGGKTSTTMFGEKTVKELELLVSKN